MHREGTLRRRLLLFISWPLLILLGMSILADYQSALGIADEAYDNALSSMVISLVTRLERVDGDRLIEIDLPPAADAILRTDSRDKIFYGVFNERDQVVAGDAMLLQLPRPAQSNRVVLGDAQLDKRALRTASYRYESATLKATVIVAETTHKRSRAANRILTAILWPNLLQLLVIQLLVYFGVRVALKPLDALGRRIAERERIFERFYRIEGSGGEGSGLGLAIVREVAERHGADIAVDSAAHGRGTCIRVDFPAPRQTPLSGN